MNGTPKSKRIPEAIYATVLAAALAAAPTAAEAQNVILKLDFCSPEDATQCQEFDVTPFCRKLNTGGAVQFRGSAGSYLFSDRR